MRKGSAYKRKDGRWEFRILMGKTSEGKRVFKSYYRADNFKHHGQHHIKHDHKREFKHYKLGHHIIKQDRQLDKQYHNKLKRRYKQLQ